MSITNSGGSDGSSRSLGSGVIISPKGLITTLPTPESSRPSTVSRIILEEDGSKIINLYLTPFLITS